MSSFEYSKVSADEKLEDEPKIPRRKSLASALFFAFTGIILFTALTLLVVGLVKVERVHLNKESPKTNSEWTHENDHKTRATGDKYLIGVGKADITG